MANRCGSCDVMLPQRMRDTMELLRQMLAVGVDAAEMNAKLDETVERM